MKKHLFSSFYILLFVLSSLMLFGESILRYDKIHIDDSLVFFPYSDTEIEVDTYDYSETKILSIYFGYETIVDDY